MGEIFEVMSWEDNYCYSSITYENGAVYGSRVKPEKFELVTDKNTSKLASTQSLDICALQGNVWDSVTLSSRNIFIALTDSSIVLPFLIDVICITLVFDLIEMLKW